MRMLVTGGAGYIGSVTSELLLRHGHDVCVVDDLSRGHRGALSPRVRFECASTLDADALDRVFGSVRPEAVLHFAASSLVGESMSDPGLYFRNNVGGMIGLLDACVAHGVRRILFSSSAATYGDPTEVPIPESCPTRPTNPYGQSKLICEEILAWYQAIHGINFGSLRYFNAAGASEANGEDHTPETHLIPLTLGAALGKLPPLAVFGLDYPTADGTCIRDYIHVLDLAEAHRLALEKLDEHGRLILNLGNGAGFSVLEIIRAAGAVTGREVPWVAAPRRAGDPPQLVASSERARSVLGWNPKMHTLEVIIESAYRWMLAHPNGYGDGPAR